MPITLLEERREVRLGHTGGIFVSVWFNELTHGSLDVMDRQFSNLIDQHKRVTLVSFVVGAAKSPPADLRTRLQKPPEKIRNGRNGNIVVVGVKGLEGVITRTFLAALSLVFTEAMTVVKNAEEAANAARGFANAAGVPGATESLAADLEAFVALPRLEADSGAKTA